LKSCRHFIEHDFYKIAIDSLTAYKQSTNTSENSQSPGFPVAMTVGGKNVGKSTLNRYL